MDNASKALIMAGAVLIAVALVGLGVYLYRSATSSIESGAKTVDEASITVNNQIVKQHGVSGTYISRNDAITLVDDIVRATYNGKMAVTELKVGGTAVSLTGTGVGTGLTSANTAFTNTTNKSKTSFKLVYEYDTNTGAINKVRLEN